MAYKNVKDFVSIEKEPWEYSFDLEWENGGYNSIEDPLDRYFIYKSTARNCLDSMYEEGKEYAKTNRGKYGDISDPDGSGGDAELSIDLYEKLWCRKKVAPEKTTFLELNNNVFDNVAFGGETMNSAQTTLNEIIKEVIQKRKEYNDDRRGRFSTNYCIHLYAKYHDEFIKDLEEFDNLKSFLNSYHTLGNFVLVPACFNGKRAGYTHDFWDSSLAFLKKYGFSLFKCEYFNRYINYFFLWDYVKAEGNKYKINPLFGSHGKIEEGESPEKSKANWTNVTTKEANEFMEKATRFIRRRGIFMTAMLKLATNEEYLETYKTLQNEIFSKDTCYNGFNEVIEKAMAHNLPSDVCAILQETERYADSNDLFESP